MKTNMEGKIQHKLLEPVPSTITSYQEIIFSTIGDFGRSQLLVFLTRCFTSLFAAWSMIMMSFAGAQPDWWTVTNTYNSSTNLTITTKHMKECPKYENQTIYFDETIYTIVSEWNLVCDRDWIPTVITTIQMFGVLIGAATIGQLGDWIGRKMSLLLCYSLDLISILVLGLSVDWHMMTTAAFFLGFSLGGYLVVISVYLLEYVGTKYRTLLSFVPAWAAGVLLFGVAFKFLPNWRHLCFATAGLGSPFVVFLWFSPKSIRWLFISGREEEGKEVLKKVTKRNKLPEPDLEAIDIALAANKQADKKTTMSNNYITLLKMEETRYKVMITSFMWFTCAFTYYALTLGVSRLAGDITVNMVLMGLGECCSLFAAYGVTKCFGRKYTTLFLFMCTALTSFGITVAYASNSSHFKVITNVLALISRFFLSAAWSSLIIYTTELFPTVVRSSAFGFASVFGRIGGLVAPQNKFLSKVSAHLPYTVNGSLAFISSMLCLLLMETENAPMDDHFQIEKDLEDQ